MGIDAMGPLQLDDLDPTGVTYHRICKAHAVVYASFLASNYGEVVPSIDGRHEACAAIEGD